MTAAGNIDRPFPNTASTFSVHIWTSIGSRMNQQKSRFLRERCRSEDHEPAHMERPWSGWGVRVLPTRGAYGVHPYARHYVGLDVWDIIERPRGNAPPVESPGRVTGNVSDQQRQVRHRRRREMLEEKKRFVHVSYLRFVSFSSFRLLLSVARSLGSFCVSHRCLSQYLLSS